jgi:hypothetical protein
VHDQLGSAAGQPYELDLARRARGALASHARDSAAQRPRDPERGTFVVGHVT